MAWCSVRGSTGTVLLYFTYLYYYSLLRGVTFKVLLLSRNALISHCWKYFWKSCFGKISVLSSYFLDVFSVLKSSSLLGRLYFCKVPEVIRSQIKETEWVFHFRNRFLNQKLLDRKRFVSWSIVTVENPVVGPKFRPFSMHSFIIST
jgi:hypothetical protein